MKKTHSLKATVKHLFIIIMILTALSMAGLSILSIRELFIRHLTFLHGSLNEYVQILSEEMETEASFVENFVLSNADLNLFSIQNYPDSKRVVPLYNIRQIIDSHDSRHSIVMIYDEKDNLAYYKGSLPFFENQEMSASLMRSLIRFGHTLAKNDSGQWNTYIYQEHTYFYQSYSKNRLTVYALFSLDNYLSEHPLPADVLSSEIAIYDKNQILTNEEALNKLSIPLDEILSASSGKRSFKGTNIISCFRQSSDSCIGFCLIMSLTRFIQPYFPRIGLNILLLFIVTLILFVAYKILCQVLVFPLHEIANVSNGLEQDSLNHLPDNHIEEYQAIQTSLQTLVEKSRALEIERQYHIQEKDHALLQYYQLQTRSHFFINCLKSLYGMLQVQRYTEMKTMLIAFANHLRYIFHDNLTVVPLSAELKEVRDYYQINLMDSDRILLLNIDCPDGLDNCLVPPLIIQSFLENTLKYNPKSGAPLVFDVKITQINDDGCTYLQIHMADNGIGYSSDVLKSLSKPLEGNYDAYHVGINNIRRRLHILFPEKNHIAIFNQPVGGACEIITFPLTTDSEGLT